MVLVLLELGSKRLKINAPAGSGIAFLNHMIHHRHCDEVAVRGAGILGRCIMYFDAGEDDRALPVKKQGRQVPAARRWP